MKKMFVLIIYYKMESKDESYEKNHTYYCYYDIRRVGGISFTNIFWTKNYVTRFLLMKKL